MALMDLLAAFGNNYPASWRTATSQNTPAGTERPQTGAGESASPDGTPSRGRDSFVPSPPPPESGVYQFQRQARLDYSLTLQFDLGAMTRSVQGIADGNAYSAEQFASAGFGLKADFDVSGYQTIRDNGASQAAHLQARSLSRRSTTRTTQFGSRQLALQAFHNEASQVRRSLDVRLRNGHRLATNRLTMRYQLDDRFSFAFLNKFNAQTARIAEEAPQQVGSYLSTSSATAENGSPGMMAAFFDAVDAYLDQSELQARAKATEFFDTAASELGFSGALVDTARDQLLGTIDSFFGRVDDAVSQMEAQYVSPSQLPAADTSLPYDLTDPALVRDRALLASA